MAKLWDYKGDDAQEEDRDTRETMVFEPHAFGVMEDFVYSLEVGWRFWLGSGSMSRDSQRSKVYRAERRAFYLTGDGTVSVDNPARAYLTLAEAQALVAKLCAHPTLRAEYPGPTRRPPTVRAAREGSRRSFYRPWSLEITLTSWVGRGFPAWEVVHELAHHLSRVGTSHGGDFCAAYLLAVRCAFGAEAEAALLGHLRLLRLRVTSDLEAFLDERLRRNFKLGAAKRRALCRDFARRKLAQIQRTPDQKIPESIFTSYR